jgi:hypothetical protein
MTINLQTSTGQDDSREIGICLSHYHHKLGPQFVAISFDFSHFDSISQYNILQDSISSRSNDLALFLDNNHGTPYTVRIKKIKILDPLARGGVQRYAIVLIIPSDTPKMDLSIEEIADDLIEKINQGANISQSLSAWHTLLNDQFGEISTENEIEIVRKIETHTHSVDLF